MNNPKVNTQNATLALARLKELTHSERDLHLAKLLNVKPTTLSTWKKRDSLDYKNIIEFCSENGFDLNYVLLGKEPVSSNIEELADLLIKKIEARLEPDLQEVKKYQEELLENLDKLRTKEELETAKSKVLKMNGDLAK